MRDQLGVGSVSSPRGANAAASRVPPLALSRAWRNVQRGEKHLEAQLAVLETDNLLTALIMSSVLTLRKTHSLAVRPPDYSTNSSNMNIVFRGKN